MAPPGNRPRARMSCRSEKRPSVHLQVAWFASAGFFKGSERSLPRRLNRGCRQTWNQARRAPAALIVTVMEERQVLRALAQQGKVSAAHVEAMIRAGGAVGKEVDLYSVVA